MSAALLSGGNCRSVFDGCNLAVRVLGFGLLLLSAAGAARAQSASCPTTRTVVDIPVSGDPQTRMCLRNLLVSSIQLPNMVVRMGPGVVFDFTDFKSMPIEIGRCTTLTSVAFFSQPPHNACIPIVTVRATQAEGRAASLQRSIAIQRVQPAAAPPSAFFDPPPPSARNTHSLGPVLRYGQHPDLSSTTAFLEARCTGGFSNDGVRLSGFRLLGPSLGDQTTNEVGFRIEGCLDVEVSNMEVAGWGGAGIANENPTFTDIPAAKPNPVRVLIHDSYFHDNRHPSAGGHAEGYGVNTGRGGWTRIFNNLFDNNRHDIAANGRAGGYDALDNLLLRGGGYHGAWYEAYTHVVDAHGTGCWWSGDLCGEAGRDFLIKENVIQYTRNSDIHIRGAPRGLAVIDDNRFARSDQDAAIDLATPNNVVVKANNQYNVNGFGQYAVCDFDGDGIDDLFFATGLTWWVSGQGRFPWTFLSNDRLPLSALRFGYFDGSAQCDAAAELPTGSGQWFISKGGRTDPFATHLVDLGHPASEIVFGRFDPNLKDHRPGITKPTTHAFWRRPDGQWFVTPLATVNWQPVQSSGFPLNQLRFGDFDGDGVTDVLAVVGGRWAISESARGAWRTLNPNLGDPVKDLYIANMDADDNIDDVLKLSRDISIRKRGQNSELVAKLTWFRSKNGREPWKVWKAYVFTYPAFDDSYVPAGYAFAGRFGRSPGQGGTLLIDENREGQFAAFVGRTQVSWSSRFRY